MSKSNFKMGSNAHNAWCMDLNHSEWSLHRQPCAHVCNRDWDGYAYIHNGRFRPLRMVSSIPLAICITVIEIYTYTYAQWWIQTSRNSLFYTMHVYLPTTGLSWMHIYTMVDSNHSEWSFQHHVHTRTIVIEMNVCWHHCGFRPLRMVSSTPCAHANNRDWDGCTLILRKLMADCAMACPLHMHIYAHITKTH